MGTGSGARGGTWARSTALRNAVNTGGSWAATKGKSSGCNKLDCHTACTVRPCARRAATSACSSGAAMASQTTVLSPVPPSAFTSAGNTAGASPVHCSKRLPRAASAADRHASVSLVNARRCGPTRSKPQRVNASGAWQYTGSSVAPCCVASAMACASAGWSCRRKSLRNQ